MGARAAHGSASFWARLERRVCDEVRLYRITRCQEGHVEHCGPREIVLEAFSQLEAEREYGRAPPTAVTRELQTFLEDVLPGRNSS